LRFIKTEGDAEVYSSNHIVQKMMQITMVCI